MLSADALVQMEVGYPLGLIEDATPPAAAGITVEPAGETSVVISWTTPEFATSFVRYGPQPGDMSLQVDDPLYALEHSLVVTGLQPGQTYYYVIGDTDLSGNTYTSTVQTLELASRQFIFLPMLDR